MKKLLVMLAIAASLAACGTSSQSDGNTVETTDSSVLETDDGTGATLTAFEEGAGVTVLSEGAARAKDRVFFDFDQSALSRTAIATLNAQVALLKANPSVKVTIEGHADERGTREYNLGLGERRASAVKNYLVSKGISSTRVNTISYGKERPHVLGSNEASWHQNRRAVTVIAK